MLEDYVEQHGHIEFLGDDEVLAEVDSPASDDNPPNVDPADDNQDVGVQDDQVQDVDIGFDDDLPDVVDHEHQPPERDTGPDDGLDGNVPDVRDYEPIPPDEAEQFRDGGLHDDDGNPDDPDDIGGNVQGKFILF